MAKQNEVGLSKWVIVGVAATALLAYVVRFFNHKFSSDPAEWGQLGDYLGGILNPLIAFGAFLWLVASVRIQKTELEATRVALTESQEAQAQQAKVSLLAARIETLNIELSSVVGQLNHYRTRQLNLLDLLNRPDNRRSYVNEYGDPIAIDVMRMEINRMIDVLEQDEKRILDEVRTLSLDLRFKVVNDPQQ